MIIRILKVSGFFVFGIILIIAIFFFISVQIKCTKINKHQAVGNELIQKINALRNKKGEYPHLVEQLHVQIPEVIINTEPAGTITYKNKFFIYIANQDHKNFDLSFPAFGIDFATYSSGTAYWLGSCHSH